MIRVNNRFIVGVTLTNSEKRTSKNFALFLQDFLGYLPTIRENSNALVSWNSSGFFLSPVRPLLKASFGPRLGSPK